MANPKNPSAAHMIGSRIDVLNMYPSKLDPKLLQRILGENCMSSNEKDQILDVVGELVQAFLYYDRQEDQDLPEGKIEDNIHDDHISVDEIVDAFRIALLDNLPDK